MFRSLSVISRRFFQVLLRLLFGFRLHVIIASGFWGTRAKGIFRERKRERERERARKIRVREETRWSIYVVVVAEAYWRGSFRRQTTKSTPRIVAPVAHPETRHEFVRKREQELEKKTSTILPFSTLLRFSCSTQTNSRSFHRKRRISLSLVHTRANTEESRDLNILIPAFPSLENRMIGAIRKYEKICKRNEKFEKNLSILKISWLNVIFRYRKVRKIVPNFFYFDRFDDTKFDWI